MLGVGGLGVDKLLGYYFGYPDGAALLFALLEILIVKRSRVSGLMWRPVAAHTDHGVVLPPDKYAGYQSGAGGHLAAHRTGAEQEQGGGEQQAGHWSGSLPSENQQISARVSPTTQMKVTIFSIRKVCF
jgi:hypothetical protein